VKQRILHFFLLLVAAAFFVTGCVNARTHNTREVDDCPHPTSTAFHSYDFGTRESKYVYVLIDKSFSYSPYVQRDLGIILSSVVNNMYPGDRLVLQWLGLDRTTQAIFSYRRVKWIEPPLLPPTPTLPPVTPTLTPGGPTTMQGLQAQTSEAIVGINRDIEQRYYCDIGNWNAISDKRFQEWKNQRQEAIQAFRVGVQKDVEEAKKEGPDEGKLIYENLFTASRMLHSAMAKSQHSAYVLIIFSDMKEWREVPPDRDIDLQGIKVIVVNETCQFAVDCDTEATWGTLLKQYGASNVKVLVAEDEIKDSLNAYLRSIP